MSDMKSYSSFRITFMAKPALSKLLDRKTSLHQGIKFVFANPEKATELSPDNQKPGLLHGNLLTASGLTITLFGWTLDRA